MTKKMEMLMDKIIEPCQQGALNSSNNPIFQLIAAMEEYKQLREMVEYLRNCDDDTIKYLRDKFRANADINELLDEVENEISEIELLRFRERLTKEQMERARNEYEKLQKEYKDIEEAQKSLHGKDQ